jgi:L-iditol 2-dehydrogenase
VRALLLQVPNRSSLVDLPVPTPASDEVVVRVGAAGICGSDVELLHGTRPEPYARYPIVPGHEWAGTIEFVGSEVHRLAPGEAVVAEGIRYCGACPRCAEGRTNLCTSPYAETGFTHPGAFAEFVAVPAPLVHRLPPDASLEAAALLEPAACVAEGLLAINLGSHLRIAVVGAGTLGLLAFLMLRATDPESLQVIDARRDRLDRAASLGADGTFLAQEAVPLNGTFDLVFEATGRPEGVEVALRLARRGGTVVLEGIGPGGADIDPNLIPLGHLHVQGVFGASTRAWRHVVDLFSRGLLDPTPLITHSFPLERYVDAFDIVQQPGIGALKVQLNPLQ